MGEDSKLGGRLKDRRLELGYTLKDVATAAGVSESALSQVERGKSKNLKIANFFAICDFLRCNPRWLGLGQGDKDGRGTGTAAVFRRSVKNTKLYESKKKRRGG